MAFYLIWWKISVCGLQCYCQGSCPNGKHNGTCEAPPGAGCFAAAEEVYDPDTDSMVAERTYGCLPSEEGGLMMCRGKISFVCVCYNKIFVLMSNFTGFKAPLNCVSTAFYYRNNCL